MKNTSQKIKYFDWQRRISMKKPGIWNQNFEILSFLDIEFEMLDISSEILGIWKFQLESRCRQGNYVSRLFLFLPYYQTNIWRNKF